jgi:hypothetical protein
VPCMRLGMDSKNEIIGFWGGWWFGVYRVVLFEGPSCGGTVRSWLLSSMISVGVWSGRS